MSSFYTEEQIELQRLYDSTGIANRLRESRVRQEFSEDEKTIIENSMFFFLATSNQDGQPDCSYKGGDKGFVRVLTSTLLAFGNYDGNGMYRSLGNIQANPNVGLLFIEFWGNKNRLRVNGSASISYDQKYLQLFPTANCVILIYPKYIFPNCPRNIHTLVMKDKSIYTPTRNYLPPEPFWKGKKEFREFTDNDRDNQKMPDAIESKYFSSNAAQSVLNNYYRIAIGRPENFSTAPDSVEQLSEIRLIEDNWMAWEESKISKEILPSNTKEFRQWYQIMLKKMNAAISEFISYVEHKANSEAIAFYILMEELVDGSFDDIMALAQLGVENSSKLAIAENYWDEMGNGDFKKIHTEMFSNSSSYCRQILSKKSQDLHKNIPTECLMNGNLMTFWSLRRKYIPRLFGAIGLIEGSAPIRFNAVTKGMIRNGFPESAIAYHREHIRIDAIHGKEWLNRVLLPHIKDNEIMCQEIARGVLIRMRIAIQYYQRLSSHMETHHANHI